MANISGPSSDSLAKPLSRPGDPRPLPGDPRSFPSSPTSFPIRSRALLASLQAAVVAAGQSLVVASPGHCHAGDAGGDGGDERPADNPKSAGFGDGGDARSIDPPPCRANQYRRNLSIARDRLAHVVSDTSPSFYDICNLHHPSTIEFRRAGECCRVVG